MIQGHLRRFPRFDVLDDDGVRRIEREMAVRRYRSGQTLIREGDRAAGPSASMYLILEGTIALTRRRPDGGEEPLRTLGPGELIGVVALLRDTSRTATCTVNNRALVASMDRLAMERLQRDDPKTWAHLQHTLALQLAADFRALHERLSEAL